jgi:quinoprotein glucose dehydrogenase
MRSKPAPAPPQRAPFSALIAGVFGLVLGAGGVWLAALGGSWFYLLAGVLLLITAGLLWRGRAAALLTYAALVVATLLWALYERGLDWWGLAARGDLIFILGLALLLPPVARALSAGRGERLALGGALGVAAVVGVVSILAPAQGRALEGHLPGARSLVAANVEGVAPGDWPAYGRTWRGDRYSPLAQITPANAPALRQAWVFHTGDLKRQGDPDEFTYEVTPIKVGGLLYVCTPHDIVFALDPDTGRQVWRFDPQIRDSKDSQHLTCRGVSYAATPAAAGADGLCAARIILGTNDARLFALDARRGQPCPDFGVNGQVDVWPGNPGQPRGWWQITSPPVIARGLAVFGGAVYDDKSTYMPSGVIQAFDVVTGRPVWAFDPERPDDPGPKAGGRYVPSSPNSWMSGAADEALGLVYFPTGMAAGDQWGGRRTPQTERFSSAVVALDIATGRPRWVFQTVHHDLWDMDVPAQPALVDLNLPGRGRVPALVQSTKTGNIFVLDRRTGVPLHPVTERGVPGGAAKGDYVSPSQPFSAVSFMPQERVRGSDMWGATILDQLACRIGFQRLRYQGAFTPPSTRGTFVFPGNFGVMDWGGMAIDPVRQVAFANPNYMAFVDRLIPSKTVAPRNQPFPGMAEAAKATGPASGSDRAGAKVKGYNPVAGAPFAVALNPFLSRLGLPCQAPPWGYVAGLDLVSGKPVWQHRNGTIRDEAPLPIPIPMGVPSLGGPLITGGGVAFLGSSLDYFLRAYDTTSGRELWKGRLPAGGQASPMTYRSERTNRQYVVIAAGGHGSLGTKTGDSIVAYALPAASAGPRRVDR